MRSQGAPAGGGRQEEVGVMPRIEGHVVHEFRTVPRRGVPRWGLLRDGSIARDNLASNDRLKRPIDRSV